MIKKYNELAEKSFRAKWNVYLMDKILKDRAIEIEAEDFRNFILTEKTVWNYTNEYWQKKAEEKIGELTILEIDETISRYEYGERLSIAEFERIYMEETFPTLMSIDDFEKIIKSTACYHCKTSIDEIHDLKESGQLRKKNDKGWTLVIDRLKPNFEYTAANCVMSCYWCNLAKTDEFSAEEFKTIGKEIRKIFERRLLG